MKNLEIDKRFIEVAEQRLGLNGYKIEKEIPFFKQMTYSRIKRGIQSISQKYLEAFCTTFNADMNYILTGESETPLPENNKINKVSENKQDVSDSLLLSTLRIVEEQQKTINSLLKQNNILKEENEKLKAKLYKQKAS